MSIKEKIKNTMKGILPMPFAVAKRELQQIAELCRARNTRENPSFSQQFDSIHKHLNMLEMEVSALKNACAGKEAVPEWRHTIIDKIELFFIKVNVERNFSHGSWKWRYQCMFRISGGGFDGWSELTIPNPEHIHQILSDHSRRFYGNTIAGGLELCRGLRGAVPDSILALGRRSPVCH